MNFGECIQIECATEGSRQLEDPETVDGTNPWAISCINVELAPLQTKSTQYPS